MVLASTLALNVGKALGKELWKMVDKGLKHESTAKNVESMEKQLGPTFADIEELARKANMPEQETEDLRMIMNQMREALLNYSEVEWWCCCLKPCYQQELEKADKSMKDFILYRLSVQMSRDLLYIICLLQTRTADQTNHSGQPQILRSVDDLEKLFPEPTVELNATTKTMEDLKTDLMKEVGNRVLNLTGLAGSGKTTLAQQLCRDKDVRGWFNDNILFVTIVSEIESNGDVAKQLKDELREKGNNNEAVLLVLDDVEPRSKQLVEQCWNQISSNPKSKILMTSKFVLEGLGVQVPMRLPGEEEAITLLRHFAQPIGASSYKFPDPHTLRQVVRGCGRLPIAIKIIGSDLQGKPNVIWQQLLKEWSRQRLDILHTYSELLTRLQKSLNVSKDYERISEFFNDLGLFPANQMIPVTALIDMWVELYEQVKDGRDAMIRIYHLTVMNLAKVVVKRRIGSDEDNYYDNHFLTQHNLLRQLAGKSSRQQEQVFESERLSIEMYGNDRPEWWPQQPQRTINIASQTWSIGSTQQRVAARILSISTDQNVTPDWCNIQAAQAEVLVLNLKTIEYTLPEFIKEMKNLKVFIVINSGFRRSTLFKNLKLLSSLQTLKRIRLQQVSVPRLWELKNLLKLSFYNCEVKMAFENSSMKLSKAMPRLEELNFEDCEDLVGLPAGLCGVVTLKKLSINNCRNFTELPGEIGKLVNLELLRISYCDNFKEMPQSITELAKLMFLDISHCQRLSKLPEDMGKLKNLTNLYVSDCPISELPDSIINLGNLRRVICDKYAYDLWEVIKGSIEGSIEFTLDVQTAKGIPLNLLRGGFEGNVEEIEMEVSDQGIFYW